MNKQRSLFEQIMPALLLSFAAFLIFNQFFGAKNQKPTGTAREAQSLSAAFAGINSGQSPLLSEAESKAAVEKLLAEVRTNDSDEYSYWARLRAGLLKQYRLDDSEGAIKLYDEVINNAAGNAIEAQALYQKGDLLWSQSTTDGQKPPTRAATQTLEQIIHKGRGSSEFLGLEILVPGGAGRFVPVKVGNLRWSEQNPDPPGLLERINAYYKTTTFYKIFDSVVVALGNDPKYSYGLAILFFAALTRLVLQPLTKRQYDSMKGMQVIAPEMKKIQEKYKEKKDQQSQVQMMKEVRALQQRHGVNPMMGCGLALVQMPIMIFLVLPFIQHYEPKMELERASFLWIQSLAGPDIPLLILYGISMFISTRLSSTPPADEQQRQMQMMMMFIFPILFPFFLLHYPSAFTLYWMMFNMVSTIFQWRMMKSADPDKNVIKTLMGPGPAIAVPATAEAVPARPQNNSKKSSGGAGKKKDVTNDQVPARVRKSPQSLNDGDDSDASALPAGLPAANGLNGSLSGNGTVEEGEVVEVGFARTDGAGQQPRRSGAKVAQGSQAGRSSRSNSQRARRRRRH